MENVLSVVTDLVTDFIPGISQVKAIKLASDAIKAGEFGQAAFEAIGLIPGGGALKKARKLDKIYDTAKDAKKLVSKSKVLTSAKHQASRRSYSIAKHPYEEGVEVISLAEKNKPIGYMTLDYNGKRPIVTFIENVSNGEAKGISEDLYNIAIKHVQDKGYSGIVSGLNLREPKKTVAVWKHFANNGKLRLVGRNGLHGMNPNGPVVLLDRPTKLDYSASDNIIDALSKAASPFQRNIQRVKNLNF